MTWISYFWSWHLWLYSFISDLVSCNLTLLILVWSSTTKLSYFWSCHLGLILVIYGTTTFLFYCWHFTTTWYSHFCFVNHVLTFLLLVLYLLSDFPLSGFVNTTWLSYFWYCHHLLTFLFLVLSSMTWLLYFWQCHHYLTMLLLILPSMTCLYYFWSCQPQLDYSISGIVIYD